MQLPVRECVCRSLFASLPLSCICLARTLTNSQAAERALSLAHAAENARRPLYTQKKCQARSAGEDVRSPCLRSIFSRSMHTNKWQRAERQPKLREHEGRLCVVACAAYFAEALQQALSCSRSRERRATRAEVTRAVCVVVIARQCATSRSCLRSLLCSRRCERRAKRAERQPRLHELHGRQWTTTAIIVR